MSSPLDLALYVVKAIVDHPDRVEAELTDQDKGPCIRIRVVQEDKGRVIGKQGKTIKAIRAVVNAAFERSAEPEPGCTLSKEQGPFSVELAE
ncbi:MAG TPA: KH domain-containing protein [Elusimicrobiota bacterium]|nr:KH domain-containing protein [Elusimicrobiota bacterium]